MRLIFIFTVLVSLASCEEARKQEAQKAADEIRYETAQKRHETNMKMIQRRSEIEIAMIEAGSPKDSIKSVIDSMYIRDSIYLNEHFDTTRYIIK